MSHGAIFLVGMPITLVVCVALGILAYAIKLESVELAAEKLQRESREPPREPVTAGSPVVSLSPADALAEQAPAKRRVSAEGPGEAAVSPPRSAA